MRYIIKRYRILIDNFTINDDGLIDVKGNVKICDGKLQKLPLRFRNVSGNFHCNSNCLKTLIGSPQWVGGSFNCSDNDLYTLKHGPVIVRGTYRCSENNLITLKGCAIEVGRDLLCNNNNLVNLVGSPDKIHGYFNCKLNKLRSLEGSPKEMFGRFHVSYNRLNDFSGAPQNMRCEIYATSNFLNNLKGLPIDYEGQLFIDASTKSLNTGEIDYNKMKVQLRIINKFGHNFIPKQILDNYAHINLIMKYQRYYDIWTIDDALDEPNFDMFIEDIEDGLL
ncbi:hypothetical protein QO200_17070 [Flavobacterium sp. Arc3]|uniref:hypothetical protein n=1 Tax=Flavobacterium sp. Arc3 TaxID=3046686 RepID=UPI00352E8A0C